MSRFTNAGLAEDLYPAGDLLLQLLPLFPLQHAEMFNAIMYVIMHAQGSLIMSLLVFNMHAIMHAQG